MKNFNLKKIAIPKFITILQFEQAKKHIIKKTTFKYITILLCMLFFATNLWSQLPASCNFRLCSYEVVPGYPKEIKYGDRDIPDLSGVTYHAGTLFMVVNDFQNLDYTYIYETETDGTVLRSIKLDGFQDTEGIVHIEGTRFALTEERKGKIAFLKIEDLDVDVSIPYNEAEIALLLDTELDLGPWGPNNGLEGVSYDGVNTIYTVKEEGPKGFYSFGLPESFPVTLTAEEVNQPCGTNSFGLVDFADVFHLGRAYSSNTGILVLSQESKKLVYIDNCVIKGEFSLDFMRQPEGITMDDKGNIYIVGEVNDIQGKFNEFVILRRNHDVNNDGIVDILDAQNAAQASIGLKTITNNCNVLPPNTLCQPRADMDCNGEINILDAYNIARLAVGLCPN